MFTYLYQIVISTKVLTFVPFLQEQFLVSNLQLLTQSGELAQYSLGETPSPLDKTTSKLHTEISSVSKIVFQVKFLDDKKT